MGDNDLKALARDLEECRSFKVIIHCFNKEILKKLVLIRYQHKRKWEDEVHFMFG